jgi:GT2 family glycosyltransferase
MNNLVSVVMPAYKRIDQTLVSIALLLGSKGANSYFDLEIIVADSSPDNKLESSIKEKFQTNAIYTRPAIPGIAANKNQGAKIAKGSIVVFCDSDIEVETDTLLKTINALKNHHGAAGVGGDVVWKGGEEDGSVDRPRYEDRIRKIGETSYIEAIYSRYFATYKEIFWKVGGYDEKVFNMRGEGSDLSIRYWRAGYPLIYEDSITVHHVHDAPDSAALRVSRPEWGIAKDFLLLAYKYDMFDREYENFEKTIYANFKKFKDKSLFRLLQGIGNNLDLIVKVKPIIDEEKKKMKPEYQFKFLEVFSDNELFKKCITKAERALKIYKRNFSL